VIRLKTLLFGRGAELLLAAGVIVGAAIALDGSVSRGLNGIAGILWIAAAGSLLREASKRREFRGLLTTTVLYCLALVVAIRPSDFLWAAVGFTAAGAAIALRSSGAPERAALLLPALWLPIHLLVAIGKAVYRSLADQPANVRTDPPPTAALVPLVMIVAAYAGGWLVGWYRARGSKPAATSR
jgi:hypothetical protein